MTEQPQYPDFTGNLQGAYDWLAQNYQNRDALMGATGLPLEHIRRQEGEAFDDWTARIAGYLVGGSSADKGVAKAPAPAPEPHLTAGAPMPQWKDYPRMSYEDFISQILNPWKANQ